MVRARDWFIRHSHPAVLHINRSCAGSGRRGALVLLACGEMPRRNHPQLFQQTACCGHALRIRGSISVLTQSHISCSPNERTCSPWLLLEKVVSAGRKREKSARLFSVVRRARLKHIYHRDQRVSCAHNGVLITNKRGILSAVIISAHTQNFAFSGLLTTKLTQP